MARSKKIGLDYFPVDVNFDAKIEAIELLYGNDGLSWIMKFWQSAYQTEFGEVSLDGLFGELMAKKCRITTELQEKIKESSINIKLIFKTAEGLYTSNGIKKRMAAVSHERLEAIKRKKRKEKQIKEKESKVKETPHCSANNLNDSKFNTFWDSYPKKQAKKIAAISFNRIKDIEIKLPLILQAISWQINSEQWKKDNGKYIPMPSTYLNQERWMDEQNKIESTSRGEQL